jgi:hypothetical protein
MVFTHESQRAIAYAGRHPRNFGATLKRGSATT